MSKPHAIIVGFGPGVGLGISTAFAKAGFNLSVISRDGKKLEGIVAGLAQTGAQVESFDADAGDPASLEKTIVEASAKLGEPEVLVYNAVAFRWARPTTITFDQLVADFRVNVAGALAAANAVIPGMKNRKSGTVLFTGGGWSLYPVADVASTAIGKASLRNLAFTLSEDLQGSGVRAGTVTIMGQVAPGTAFDPAKIGDAFLSLYNHPSESFPVEVQFKGA